VIDLLVGSLSRHSEYMLMFGIGITFCIVPWSDMLGAIRRFRVGLLFFAALALAGLVSMATF